MWGGDTGCGGGIWHLPSPGRPGRTREMQRVSWTGRGVRQTLESSGVIGLIYKEKNGVSRVLLWMFNKSFKIAVELYNVWNVCLAAVMWVSRVRSLVRPKPEFSSLCVLALPIGQEAQALDVDGLKESGIWIMSLKRPVSHGLMWVPEVEAILLCVALMR